jgi:DNA-binding winged helix-turn-helix (wHTH) protein
LVLRFGDFVLDRDARQIFRGGMKVHLPPKALIDPPT